MKIDDLTIFHKYHMRDLINIIEAAQHEATPEEVSDIIHEFANKLERDMNRTPAPPYNEVYGEDNQEFPQIFMGGYPEDGFSKEAALHIIQPLVTRLSSMGWFLSKHFEASYQADDDEDAGEPQLMIYFGFFPHKGQIEHVPQKVYHVAPRVLRNKIAREGLLASQGGSDFIHTESGRVYVILDDMMIDDIKNDIWKHRGPQELDVWVIDTWALPEEWYQDIELPGVAAWTPNDIPASAIWLD